MNACYVAECTEGGDFIPETHQLINEFIPKGFQKPFVFIREVTGSIFLRGQEAEIISRVESEDTAFVIQKRLQDRKENENISFPFLRGRGSFDLRKIAGTEKVIGKTAPAIFRNLTQQRGEGISQIRTRDPGFEGKHRSDPLQDFGSQIRCLFSVAYQMPFFPGVG